MNTLVTPLLAGLVLATAAIPPACAEVTTDGTMGAMANLAGPNFAIPESLGTTANTNLFHSFSQFNLSNGQSATFSGSNTINNIISRVTGGSASSIDGSMRSTIPGANLFFLNPYGILFGPNASIDVSGGFHPSTAHYLELSDTGRFDALNPDASTLSVDPPTAFGFDAGPVQPISVSGSRLLANDGEPLTLVGGDITIEDGVLASAGGEVALASVQSAGTVPVDISAMNLSDFASQGDIHVSDPAGGLKFIDFKLYANVDISGDAGGGRILIRGGNLYVENANLRSVNSASAGGPIDIQTSADVTLSQNASLSTSSEGSARAGDVLLRAGRVNMQDNAAVESDVGDTGDGGTVRISAGELNMQDRAGINANTLWDGRGGSVQVDVGAMDMRDLSSIRTLSAFPCNAAGCVKDAGNITINADSVTMAGDATVDSSTFFFSDGRAGIITVNASELQMADDAWFISNTFTQQDAGQIDMNIDQVNMQGRSVISTTTFADGNGGVVTLDGNTLTLSGDSIITSGTEGPGEAGDVIINMDQINLQGDARISSESEGDNGFVRGGADLSGATGGGAGGNVSISMSNTVLSGGADITASTSGSGDAGSITIRGTTLEVNNGASISALSGGTGEAGSIIINLGNYLQMVNGAISVQTDTANAGDINISATQLVHLVNSIISTSAANGLGNGGNITIDPVFVVLNNSQIIAQAAQGNGGNITIVTQNFLSDSLSVIDASSQFGLDGTVTIVSLDEEVTTTPEDVPSGFAEVIEIAADQCEMKTRKDISSLVISDRDGLPPSPDRMLSAGFGPSRSTPAAGVGRSFHPRTDSLYAIVCLR